MKPSPSYHMLRPSQTIIGFLLFCFVSLSAQSQSSKYHLNLFAGSQGIACQKIWQGGIMDFLNYLEAEGYSENYLYIGVLWHYEINSQLEGRIMVGMQSDMAPVLLNLSTSYFFGKRLGLGVSFFGYPEILSNFQFHHQSIDAGMADFSYNSRSRRIYSMGFAIGPDYRLRYPNVTFDLRLHGGARWISSFSEGFLQKQVNGNYIRAIEYQTHNSPAFYFYPQAELGFRLFSLNSVAVGIKVKAALELSNRSIDYTQRISEWVYEPYTRTITPYGHSYRKFDYDFGLNFSW